MSRQNPTYKLRFFFDYNCGGCLWADNEAAYQKFDVGTLDTTIYDLNGNISQKPKIELPDSIRQKVLKLDDLFLTSLDFDDPTGPSLWTEKQWDDFEVMTKVLHQEIAEYLGEDFEIIYKQSIYKN